MSYGAAISIGLATAHFALMLTSSVSSMSLQNIQNILLPTCLKRSCRAAKRNSCLNLLLPDCRPCVQTQATQQEADLRGLKAERDHQASDLRTLRAERDVLAAQVSQQQLDLRGVSNSRDALAAQLHDTQARLDNAARYAELQVTSSCRIFTTVVLLLLLLLIALRIS